MEYQQPQKGGVGAEDLTRRDSTEHNRHETIIPIEDNMNVHEHPQVGQGSPKLGSGMEHQQPSQEGGVGVGASMHQGSFEHSRVEIARLIEAIDSLRGIMESQILLSVKQKDMDVFKPELRILQEPLKMAQDDRGRDIIMVAGSSTNETMAGVVKSPRVLTSVQDHANNKCFSDLPKAAYLSIKGDDASSWGNLDELFHYKSPFGNTVLHIASRYGKDKSVKKIIDKHDSKLLTAKNDNGDTPLHVAARDGCVSTLKILLAAYLRNLQSYSEELEKYMDEILPRNKQGNTFFHEALFNKDKGVINFLLSDEAQFEVSGNNGISGLVERAALFWDNNEQKSILYLAIEAGYKEVVDKIMVKLINKCPPSNKLIEDHPELTQLIPHRPDYVPAGKSPLLAAIIKKDKGILEIILTRKPEWIHLRDLNGMIPLHYAASVGYLQGVQYLLEKCPSCADDRDKYGFLPLHLASSEGHVKVVKNLLQFCPYPRETLDKKGRNILHIAAQSGKFSMVKYILRTIDNVEREMINDKDVDGNTPLHLATIYCHPKVVHALTWDKRVNLSLVNADNRTPLDVCGRDSSSLRQLLTWIALKSAGVPPVKTLPSSIKVPPNRVESLRQEQNEEPSNTEESLSQEKKEDPPNTEKSLRQKQNSDPDMGQSKDSIGTLIVVSTLIITATFAAGFVVPNSGDSSDTLNRAWFKVFIFCTTLSMYGSVAVTLILIWAQLGNIYLALGALQVAKPLLGVTLAALSVAFLAGVHLIINNLSWFATTILAMSLTFTLMLLLLYVQLWMPSSSQNKLVRYISYYPFLMVASLVERE